MRRPRASTLFPYTTLFRSTSSSTTPGAPGPCCSSSAPGGGRSGHAELSAELGVPRSEEHTSELQSLRHLVCRLLLEKKNKGRAYTRQISHCNRSQPRTRGH